MIKIRELTVSDSEELAAFYASQSGQSERALHDRLQWLGRNPAAKPDIPLGVAAYNETGTCGAMVYVPTQFSDGTSVRTCVLSILFYVDASARGAGLSLFMAYRGLADRYPLYAATANAVSAHLWSKFGGKPVEGSDREYVRVCHPIPVAMEFVLRMFPRRRGGGISDRAAPTPNGSKIDRFSRVDDAETALRNIGNGNVGSYRILRDAAMIRWKTCETGGLLYWYWTRDSECICVLRQSRRGSRLQISSVDVLDLWGTLGRSDYADLLSCIEKTFSPDVITFSGCSSLAKMPGLAERFRERRFPCHSVWLMDPNAFLENRFEYSPLAGE